MTIKVMQTAHVITKAGARVTGSMKLLDIPGGGGRAGSVTLIKGPPDSVVDPMKRDISNEPA